MVKLELVLSWPHPTTRALKLNQVRAGRKNTLLSCIFFFFGQFFPLAKPNQKPEGKAVWITQSLGQKVVYKWVEYRVERWHKKEPNKRDLQISYFKDVNYWGTCMA